MTPWNWAFILGFIFPPSLLITLPALIIGAWSKNRQANRANLHRDARSKAYQAYLASGGERLLPPRDLDQVTTGDLVSGYIVHPSKVHEYNVRRRREIAEGAAQEAAWRAAARSYDDELARRQAEAKAEAEAQRRQKLTDYAAFQSLCESEAEKRFLAAAIDAFELKNDSGQLVGTVTLQLQEAVGKYRADFLFDRSLIVEVDGREHHAGRENAQRDAKRDAAIRATGYRILRIPAYRVIHTPEAAMADVKDALRLSR